MIRCPAEHSEKSMITKKIATDCMFFVPRLRTTYLLTDGVSNRRIDTLRRQLCSLRVCFCYNVCVKQAWVKYIP